MFASLVLRTKYSLRLTHPWCEVWIQTWWNTPFNIWTLYFRVFSLNFWWGGTQNFWSPSVPDGDKSDGGTREKNLTEAKTAHLMQNNPIFCCFKHEIQLLKVLELKSSQIWHKNVFKFSGMSLGCGDKPWSKNGDKCRMGDWQNFCWMGGTPSPSQKKKNTILCHYTWWMGTLKE